MIQNVSNVTSNNLQKGFASYSTSSNSISKSNNTNQLSDKFTNLNLKSQVAFTGGPAGLIKEVKIGGVMARFGEEAKGAIGGIVRKLKGNDEIPFAEKPAILKMESDSSILNSFKDALNHLDPNSSTAREMKNLNLNFDSDGHLTLASRQELRSLTSEAHNDPSFHGSADTGSGAGDAGSADSDISGGDTSGYDSSDLSGSGDFDAPDMDFDPTSLMS